MIIINTYNTAPDFYLQSAAIKNLCEKFDFVRKTKVGESLCGREITALSLGARKNQTLYVAGIHGSEWLNILFILTFFEEVALGFQGDDERLRPVLEKRGFAVIPCLNPDGTEISIHSGDSCPEFKERIKSLCRDTKIWKANARGVDLNHNFDAGWTALKKLESEAGIKTFAPTRFGGYSPFSEPETKALRNLCLGSKFSRAIAFHSQGREVYCTYKTTPESAFALGKTFAENSGYKLSLPDKSAVGGGFKDWMIGYLKTPAITVETGLGENPLPMSDFQNEYKRIRKAMLACLLL